MFCTISCSLLLNCIGGVILAVVDPWKAVQMKRSVLKPVTEAVGSCQLKGLAFFSMDEMRTTERSLWCLLLAKSPDH